MRATLLTFHFLVPFLNCVSGQYEKEASTERSKVNLINLSSACTCSEISNEDGTHFVLNIQCSELDRIENVPDLDKIEWPANPNGLKITATFEGLGLTTLSKLPPNSQVEILRFNNNAIKTYWPDPFSDVSNLKKLSFSQNELTQITPDLFTNIDRLEDLDLSYNKLSEFNVLDFKILRHVKRFNLQGNQLKKIPIEALEPMTSLEDLDLSKNGIYDLFLQRSETSLKSVKRLNLNGNMIRSVMKDAFTFNNSIELLDLSNNLIEMIEENAFLTCTSLRELNLGQNNITLIFELPPIVQIVILRENTLYHWPKFPTGIKYIDLSYNRLSDLYDESKVDFSNLEVLYIGGNQLKEIDIQKKLPKLYSLDLSYNSLKEIPPCLNNQNLPSLEELRLDGNPMDNVYFKNIVVLKTLYMNYMKHLSSVDDKAFSNVVGRPDGEKDCFTLYLSNCKSLSEIHEGAFSGTNLCMLDLSKNNLSRVSANLVPWREVPADLQYNPWHCGCDLQWVLDDVLPNLYSYNSLLLNDFRCGSPRAVAGLRLIHWFNWTEQPLCANGHIDIGENYLLPSTEQDPFLSRVTPLTLVLAASIIVSLLVAIALIVYLIKTRKRYRIKQSAMQRKRQSALDSKTTNGTQKEQILALNKT